MSHQSGSTVSSLFRHPLVIAIPIYVVLLSFPWLNEAKLWLMEPVALASSGAQDAPEQDLSDDERLSRDYAHCKDDLARANQNCEYLRQQLSQLTAAKPVLADDVLKGAIPARIIRRGDSSNWRHAVYVNRGSRHGIREGFPVTIGKTLAGRVLYAAPDVSLVQLITDPDFVAPVSILPNSDATDKSAAAGAQQHAKARNSPCDSRLPVRGLLRGNASATPCLPRLRLEDVELGAGVETGMTVVTNEGAAQFPAGLLVGTVAAAHSRKTFLHVDVDAALDAEHADIVLILPYRRPTLDEAARMMVAAKMPEPKSKG